MSHFFYLAPEILLPFSPLTSKEFELIRRKARELWQDETRWSAASVTTYSGSYREKQLDEATCSRLAQRAGQQQFGYKRTPLLGSSVYTSLPGQAGSHEATDGKGALPDITRPSQSTPYNVKHKVTSFYLKHLDTEHVFTLGVKPKKPGLELLMNYRTRGKNLLRQFGRQWDYESKFGSSENSETDRCSSDYGGSSLLILN